MQRHSSFAAALSFLIACATQPPSKPDARTSAPPTASETTQRAPLPTSTTGAPAACAGLAPKECAQTTGCILDQPTHGKLVCRAAENVCEAAVRHADLIGDDADPKVTAAINAAAVTTCNATPGCAATEGECSCPCAVFGDCDCVCGGAYLRRCVLKSEQARYEGAPPSMAPSSLLRP